MRPLMIGELADMFLDAFGDTPAVDTNSLAVLQKKLNDWLEENAPKEESSEATKPEAPRIEDFIREVRGSGWGDTYRWLNFSPIRNEIDPSTGKLRFRYNVYDGSAIIAEIVCNKRGKIKHIMPIRSKQIFRLLTVALKYNIKVVE